MSAKVDYVLQNVLEDPMGLRGFCKGWLTNRTERAAPLLLPKPNAATSHLGLRGQVDWVPTHFFGTHQYNIKESVGLVYRF